MLSLNPLIISTFKYNQHNSCKWELAYVSYVNNIIPSSKKSQGDIELEFLNKLIPNVEYRRCQLFVLYPP